MARPAACTSRKVVCVLTVLVAVQINIGEPPAGYVADLSEPDRSNQIVIDGRAENPTSRRVIEGSAEEISAPAVDAEPIKSDDPQ